MRESGVKFGTSGARGLVSAMSDEVCYAYTAAFLKAVASEAKQVVLGHDLRPSSPAITSACAAAIRDAGKEVVYAGALPTPALAYYASLIGAPAIIVTGSHIPFDRNGIKFYRAEGEISKADEASIGSANISLSTPIRIEALPHPDEQVCKAYIQRYVEFFGADSFLGSKIAIYQHSSVARDILSEIFLALGAKVIPLGRADSFVPIDTEAVRVEDIRQARSWAKEHDFDAIVSTDGDADRPLIGDEMGVWLRGDVAGILCARYLQAQVVVTPVSSNTAVERCGWFDQVIRTRIGSPYVIEAMASVKGSSVVVGYEANGGFLLGTEVMNARGRLVALPTRDAVLPMLALLGLAKQRGCKLSQLGHDLPARFTASDRLQEFATERSASLISGLLNDRAQLAKLLAPQSGEVKAIDQTDGLRVTFNNGDIVHLRPSGNAPELRCYAESDTTDRAQTLCADCLSSLSSKLTLDVVAR